jgi:hypothetical protein
MKKEIPTFSRIRQIEQNRTQALSHAASVFLILMTQLARSFSAAVLL